jgi:hypothetical protein
MDDKKAIKLRREVNLGLESIANSKPKNLNVAKFSNGQAKCNRRLDIKLLLFNIKMKLLPIKYQFYITFTWFLCIKFY